MRMTHTRLHFGLDCAKGRVIMKKAVSMTIDENLLEQVKAYAESWHMSVSAAVSYILSNYLEMDGGV